MKTYPSFLNYTIAFLFIIALSSPLQSQFIGTNLMEAQFGKIPTEVNDPFASWYNRTLLNYQYKKWKASVTLENYYTKFGDRNYTDLSQLSLRYKDKHWDLKLGSFYETIGRGTLLRAFEVKGAILEDLGFRTRSYFHRDIVGGSAKYRNKNFTIHLMHGDVLNNLIPPTFGYNDRRTDSYNSLSTQYKYYKKHKFELVFFNFTKDQSDDNNYLSGSLSGSLPAQMSYHLEYSSSITNSNQYALYGNLTGFVGNLSYSAEFKNYQNFILGGGINEPAALVKQQTYRMLNRSTHVSNPLSETGIQLDLYYSFADGSILNVNHAIATNEFGNSTSTFRQYFMELSSELGDKVEYKLYLDYSKDPFKGEMNRYATGLYTNINLSKKLRLQPEVEFQIVERGVNNIGNHYYSIGFSYDSKFNINFQLEKTTDPFLLFDNTASRYYPGVNMRYKLNRKHSIQMFGGSRRGGPACSAGVCYEILDFKGIEFRISSRF